MKLLTNILLLMIAISLSVILLPIGFLTSLIYAIFKGHGEDYLFKVAISIDQMGNTVCDKLFNWSLIRSSSVNKFGNEDETISSVLGKNKEANTLTFTGKCLSKLLDTIQKNHVENSINK